MPRNFSFFGFVRPFRPEILIWNRLREFYQEATAHALSIPKQTSRCDLKAHQLKFFHFEGSSWCELYLFGYLVQFFALRFFFGAKITNLIKIGPSHL